MYILFCNRQFTDCTAWKCRNRMPGMGTRRKMAAVLADTAAGGARHDQMSSSSGTKTRISVTAHSSSLQSWSSVLMLMFLPDLRRWITSGLMPSLISRYVDMPCSLM